MPLPTELNAPRQPRSGKRMGAAAGQSLAEELSLASSWELRARLAHQARLTYAVEALPFLVEKLHQGNLRKREITESAGALLFSAVTSGIMVLIRLLGVLFGIGLAGCLAFFLLDSWNVLFHVTNPKLLAFSQSLARYVLVAAALAGIIYLSRGWVKLGCHLVVREMHYGVGLLKLGGLMALMVLLVLVLPLEGFEDPFWKAIVGGYLVTLIGCFLQVMLAEFDGYLIEAEFGEHSDNLYRLAFAIHAHAAVDNITQLVRSEAARRLCKNCLVPMELTADQVLNTQYYRCRSCFRIYDGVQVLADQMRVVAVLDTGWSELEHQEGDILFVNALQRAAGFSFDEVLIQQAADAQVERFIMKVENDLEAGRRSASRPVICRVATSLALSAHTRNLLRHTFTEIHDV